MAQRIRSIKTFSSDDIIGIVNVFVDISKPAIENTNLIDGGDVIYRKIEVKLLQGTTTIMCKVTHAERVEMEKKVLVFMIEQSNKDIYILPIDRKRYSKDFVRPMGIYDDFARIQKALGKIYKYFAENRQLWNLEGVEFPVNKQLTNDWYLVEEIIITDY